MTDKVNFDKMTSHEEDKWYREQDNIKYFKKGFIEFVIEKKITNENITNFIIPYFGNDYKKLNKDIDRNMHILGQLNELIKKNELDESQDKIKSFIKFNLQKQIKLLDDILTTENLMIDPPFLPHLTNGISFDLIFVRHGVSCANVISHEDKEQNKVKYYDPELTKAGISRTIELHPKLLDKINLFWKNEPYSINASSMMRAQETAYYMIAKETNKSINIMPHIAEKSLGATNTAFPKEKQLEMIGRRNPEIPKFLTTNSKDDRKHENFFSKSSCECFLDWANDHLEFFEKGSDGVYRAVIFSHGLFLYTAFNKVTPENNDIYHAIINNSNYMTPSFEYFKLKTLTDEYKKCPNECRISFC
jgi:broad specificity phosphatase PhoE